MLKKIESLRQKPRHIRNAYAFWIALLVTLCIAGFWVVSVTSGFLQSAATVQEQKPTESSFVRTLGSFVGDFKAVFIDMKRGVTYKKDSVPTDTRDSDTLDLKKLYEESLVDIPVPLSTTSTSTIPPQREE